jgi:N-acetylmuramoyl-L-alanine amidase
MDKMLLKKAAIQSVALMIAVITSSFALQQYQTVAISASNILEENTVMKSYDQAQIDVMSQDSIPLTQNNVTDTAGDAILPSYITEHAAQIREDIYNKLGDNYLIIQKPKAEHLSINLTDIYINHSIQLDMSGLIEADIAHDTILRVRGKEFYQGDPMFTEVTSQETDEDGSVKEVVTKDYGTDLCHMITVTAEQNKETGLYDAKLLLELDSVYAYIVYEDDNNYYIDLKKPSEVYDKILVIDAGHGGKDAGAVSKNEDHYEKDINLAIVLQLKELLDKENIKVYYTRTGDDKVFLRPRVTLANNVDCDYFISIHCNSNEVTSPNGTEVLYYNNIAKGVSNQSLAKLFSQELAKTVPLQCRGVVEKYKDEVFIMEKSQVPTILVEVGYLSNHSDLNYLCDQENRKTIAQGIFNSIMSAYNKLPVTRK